jgi:arginyl-tRNA synthetase
LSSINNLIKEHHTISCKSYKKNEKNFTIKINEVLENFTIAGPGFLNFTLATPLLIRYIDEVLRYDQIATAIQNKKMLVEFGDPNPFKEFHIGHLRNISLGESYARLFEGVGAEVFRLNYQGDVGMHVAKSLYGILNAVIPAKAGIHDSGPVPTMDSSRLRQDGNDNSADELKTPKEKAEYLGKCYAYGAKAFEENSEAKQEIVELNKKIYKATMTRGAEEKEIYELWKKYRQWSLEYFETVYARVGTKYVKYYFESEVGPIGLAVVKSHLTDHIFEESEGAIVYKGEGKGLHTRVFVTKENYPTYEGKDLGLALQKAKDFEFDLSVYSTGNEQNEYFKVMFSALSQINPTVASKVFHSGYGMVNLKDGKMSSRTGNVVTADWLLGEAKDRVKSIMNNLTIKQFNNDENKDQKLTDLDIEEISEVLAIASVKYSMLKVSSPNDIAFNLDESISLEGDSGPYLMYTFSRCKSIFRKLIGSKNHQNSDKLYDLEKVSQMAKMLSNEESRVLRQLYKFPEIVLASTRNLAPHMLCTYLFELTQAYNAFYHEHTILGREEDRKIGSEQESKRDFRLWLTDMTGKIIQRGLHLLGILTVERM